MNVHLFFVLAMTIENEALFVLWQSNNPGKQSED
jgi:hypothetical protein